MQNFLEKRREPLLDEHAYAWLSKYIVEESIPDYLRMREDPTIDAVGRGSMRWHISRDYFSNLILLYSGGERIEAMATAAPTLLDSIDDHLTHAGAVIGAFDLAVQTYYVDALWLLSLTKLLGLGDTQVERVANFYAADETNDGADELFERILAKLGRKSFEAEGLLHEDPYQLLLDCIKAEPQDRPGLMAQFLKRWFKGQKECDWWGSHIPRKGTTVLDTGFFGYWAFEAALVTYLWDIDDSSYRDLPHYPKDLADHARQSAAAGQTAQFPMRVLGGQPCPRTGDWFTPARPSSRRRFTQGEPMPDIGGAWGATLWQWDARQG